MGLIQREIERAGISTVGLSIIRSFSEKVRPPRTLFLEWAFGHPLGRPFNRDQQRAVCVEAFKALCAIRQPGDIVDIPFKWDRQCYDDYDFPGELHKLEGVPPECG